MNYLIVIDFCARSAKEDIIRPVKASLKLVKQMAELIGDSNDRVFAVNIFEGDDVDACKKYTGWKHQYRFGEWRTNDQ